MVINRRRQRVAHRDDMGGLEVRRSVLVTEADLRRLDEILDARDRLIAGTGKIPPNYYVQAIAERLEITVTEVEARMRARETP